MFYEFRKFVGLLLKSNPNVMGMLWLRDEHVIYADENWRFLKENRDAFVSRQAYHSFVGYARSQFSRMTRTAKPEPERQRRLKELESEIEYRKTVGRGDSPYANTDLRYLSTQRMREKINGLKGQRSFMGAKRKALVERHGHDVKNSAHLIRLLRMGIEFLQSGELQVYWPDAGEIIEINRGGRTLEETICEAEKLFAQAEEAYERSTLPEKPDRKRAEEVCVSVLRSVHLTT